MKRFLTLLCCGLATAVLAQEPAEFFAEDFANQSIIWVQDSKETKKCQAARILPAWYLTAAHCVYPACNKNCKVTVQLLSGALQGFAAVRHSTADAHVFVPSSYRPNTDKAVRSDIALIHFTPEEQDYWFIDTASSQTLDYKTFLEKLNSLSYQAARNQWYALAHARPKLLRMGNLDNRRITVPLAVPDLRADDIYFKQSQAGDFYYSNQLRYYIGKNFGVEQGMSGSAVVVPGGDILGVVSANRHEAGSMVAYNEKDEPVMQLPYSADYFLFTPISRSNASFIQTTVRSFREKGNSVKIDRVGADVSEMIESDVQDIVSGFTPPVPAEM